MSPWAWFTGEGSPATEFLPESACSPVNSICCAQRVFNRIPDASWLGSAGALAVINQRSDDDMDKDRIAGAAKETKGTIKEAAGKVIGDAKLTAEGRATRPKARSRTPSAV